MSHVWMLALACTGPESNITALTPEIAVSPAEIDFGEVIVDYEATATIEVINAGRATLEVTGIGFVAPEGGADVTDVYWVDTPTFELAGDDDERQEVIVSFLPPTYLTYDATMIIASNDGEMPFVEVPITGFGGDGPTPDINLSASSLDFAEVLPGEIGYMTVDVENIGDGLLEITHTEQTGSGAFTILTDPDGSSVAAESFTSLVFTYTPTTLDGDSGSFIIESNDPDEPSVQIVLLGNDGGDYEYPVAVIDCPSEIEPLSRITLDGSGSFDPNGFVIEEFIWSVEEIPGGSNADWSDTAGDSFWIDADIAGDYEITLQVVNEFDVASAPAKCKMDAIPTDDIHVELIWDTGNADLDLHMFSSTSVELYDSPDDVCWCNPNPDWGTSDTSDDPSLDLDDISGTGPENINVESGADGEYPVRVHYFTDNGDGVVSATVRFYLGGELEAEYTTAMERNEVWEAGTVKWPDRVVVEEGSVYSNDDGPRSCW